MLLSKIWVRKCPGFAVSHRKISNHVQKENNHVSFEWKCPFWVLGDIYRSGTPGGIRTGPHPTGWSLSPKEHLDPTSGSRDVHTPSPIHLTRPQSISPIREPLKWSNLAVSCCWRSALLPAWGCRGARGERFTVFWRDRVILHEAGTVTSWVVSSSFPS